MVMSHEVYTRQKWKRELRRRKERKLRYRLYAFGVMGYKMFELRKLSMKIKQMTQGMPK